MDYTTPNEVFDRLQAASQKSHAALTKQIGIENRESRAVLETCGEPIMTGKRPLPIWIPMSVKPGPAACRILLRSTDVAKQIIGVVSTGSIVNFGGFKLTAEVSDLRAHAQMVLTNLLVQYPVLLDPRIVYRCNPNEAMESLPTAIFRSRTFRLPSGVDSLSTSQLETFATHPSVVDQLCAGEGRSSLAQIASDLDGVNFSFGFITGSVVELSTIVSGMVQAGRFKLPSSHTLATADDERKRRLTRMFGYALGRSVLSERADRNYADSLPYFSHLAEFCRSGVLASATLASGIQRAVFDFIPDGAGVKEKTAEGVGRSAGTWLIELGVKSGAFSSKEAAAEGIFQALVPVYDESTVSVCTNTEPDLFEMFVRDVAQAAQVRLPFIDMQMRIEHAVSEHAKSGRLTAGSRTRPTLQALASAQMMSDIISEQGAQPASVPTHQRARRAAL